MNSSIEPPLSSSSKRYKPEPPKDARLYPTQQAYEQHELESHQENDSWHHLPLLLVALPPLLSIVHGRAENWSDAILLLLVAFYLYQLVKVPWEMYYASQTRVVLPSSLSPDSPAEDPFLLRQRESSAAILHRNELIALLSTFLVPILGSYLLLYVRGFLSDPDRYINPGLVNMFGLATSVKPFLHFIKLIKNQSLYHQELVHYPSTQVHVLTQKIEKLESDLHQLSRAFATKSDIRTLRDGVDAPLSQLEKAMKRFSRKEEYLRLTSEEKFLVLGQKIEEQEKRFEEEFEREREERERERERERRRRENGELDFVRFLGRYLGRLIALPVYSDDGQDSTRKRKGAGGTKKKELGWYERGLKWYFFWPINVPKATVEWIVEKTGTTVKGIEEGYGEEKEIKLGGRDGGGGRRSNSTTTTRKIKNSHHNHNNNSNSLKM
ncbi:uncharacterized protein JCM6883_005413 [Sporobolomyces salmoneus]|uniref:uncharacterized protein n=1 Tax=Sporobolomyces salmoneus TaxID=183962 RepID=UPI00317191B4